MKRKLRGAQRFACASLVVVMVAVSLGGCRFNGSSKAVTPAASSAVPASAPAPAPAPAPSPAPPPPAPSPSGPTIAGNPAPTATVGQPYSFRPQVSSASGAMLSYTIAQKPGWATFNPASGQLSGTPAAGDVGIDAGIAITVSDGTTSAALPAFSITVAPPTAVASVSLSWEAPTENSDGTPLIDLAGYRVKYGQASQTYSATQQVANPGVTAYVVQNLTPGTYYFAVTAYNSAGVESPLSPEVSTPVN